MAGVNQPFTAANTIFYRDVTDDALFNGDKKADRMAAEIFYDEFLFYMDKTYEELD